jgi:protein-S-isoprenylcysteine O-methyltransferase Ste14
VFLLQMILIRFANQHIKERTHVPNNARRTMVEKYTGIIGNTCFLVALGYSVFLPLLLGTILFYLGLSVFTLGLSLFSFATFSFVTTPKDQLIQKGVYKFSRHPMYLAIFLICLGTGIASASCVFMALSVILAICFYYEARIEERYCLEKYKDVYKEYMNSAPRWIGILKKSMV